jgi:hypothetical protein
MHTLKTKIVKLLTVIIFTLSSLSVVSAQEINTQSFSGTVNTTLTSGFTIRASDRDCQVNFGYQHTSVVDAWGSVYSQNGAGCSGYRTDGFGNTSTEYINIAGSNPNSDDGNLNYNQGDVVNATQKFYTEVIGDGNGFGLNLSLTGSYNPVNDINAPNFKKLKGNALRSQEQDLTLLNAYITTEFDTGSNYIDATIGRSVVSWGEATFIPITANGLVTGALDITKLRAPGSSIKEALLPVEQIVLATNVNGIGFEGYYQLKSDMVQLDVAGSFFGSEIVGLGEAGIIAGGGFQDERAGNPCPYQLTAGFSQGAGANCSAAIVALSDASGAYSADAYFDRAFDTAASFGTALTIASGITATKTFGSDSLAYSTMAAGTAGIASGKTYADLTTKTKAGYAMYQNSVAGFSAALVAAGTHTVRPTERIAGVQIMVADDGKFKRAKDDGQFGLKLTSYIDQAGGIDLSVYFANYHSKVPYLRIKGQKGLFAGDLYGLFTAASYDEEDNNFSALAAFKSGGAYDGAFTGYSFGKNIIKGVEEIAYSSAICNAALGKALASAYSGGATGSKFSTTVQERSAWANLYMSTSIAGEKSKLHDPLKCYNLATSANATTDLRHNQYGSAIFGSASATDKTGGAKDTHLALMGTAAMIGAAITPMNYFEYDFIFPEDNQIFGTSFSTVLNGTVVQGELSFRPDFPLATPAGSQVNQLADAAGSTQLLNWVAFNQIDGLGQTIATTADTDGASSSSTGDALQLTLALQMLGQSGNYTGEDTGVYTALLRDFKRSSLPAISTATVIAGDYYSTPFIEYDVWSADIGTTSAFNASHPITLGLGADSAVLLTELGMVHIADLNNSGGYVARGGFSESGDSPENCKGAFGSSNTYTATKSVTNIGAAQVDGLFGNGGYCEINPGAAATSFTYRIIGSATYNNFANSQWSLAPNFAWSHDPEGNGPSSLGGFVEGRMSLSLGMRANKGAVSASLSYVNQLGDPENNLSIDKDTLAASISYAF